VINYDPVQVLKVDEMIAYDYEVSVLLVM